MKKILTILLLFMVVNLWSQESERRMTVSIGLFSSSPAYDYSGAVGVIGFTGFDVDDIIPGEDYFFDTNSRIYSIDSIDILVAGSVANIWVTDIFSNGSAPISGRGNISRASYTFGFLQLTENGSNFITEEQEARMINYNFSLIDSLFAISRDSFIQTLTWTQSTGDLSILHGNTVTIQPMTGASILVDGEQGLVPKPLANQDFLFLRGDGTWANPTTGGDNWGSQTVQTDATIDGDGLGPTPLKIAQQGAKNGQALLWNGSTWLPGDITGGDNQTVDSLLIVNDSLLIALENDEEVPYKVDLSQFLDNDTVYQAIDTFELVGSEVRLSISEDGELYKTIDLTSLLDNTDTQDLSFSGDTLYLVDGGEVYLGNYLDNTDDQTVDSFLLQGNTIILALEDDNEDPYTIDLSSLDVASDTTRLVNDSILVYYSNGEIGRDTIRLPASTDTDNQTLVYNGSGDLSIIGGNSVDLSDLLDNDTIYQTIDTFEIIANTLRISISDDGELFKSVDLSGYLDNTDTQDLSFSNDTLYLVDGGEVYLGDYLDDTDKQTVDTFALDGNILTLALERDNEGPYTVDLSSLAGLGTDDQTVDSLFLDYLELILTLEDDNEDPYVIDFQENVEDWFNDFFIAGTNLASVYDDVFGFYTLNATQDTTRLIEDSILVYSNGGELGRDTIRLPASTDSDNQTLTYNGLGDLEISNGNSVDISDLLDNDTIYQQVDTFTLVGTTLGISLSDDGVEQKTVDLSSLQDGIGTDDQTVDSLIMVGNLLVLALEDDNETEYTVDLSQFLDNTDTQDLSFSGDTLYLVDGGSVYLGNYYDNDTIYQDLGWTQSTGVLTITNGTGVTINPMTGASGISDGEQGLVPKPVTGQETLFLRGDGVWSNPSVGGDNWGAQVVQSDATLDGDGTGLNNLKLAQQGAGTGQVLKWNGSTWLPGDDLDNQTVDSLLLDGNDLVLTLEGDNESPYTLDLSSFLDNDTIYQQVDTFEINSHILGISLSNDGIAQKAVDLSPYINTDAQTLTYSGLGDLNISGGNSVDLSDLLDNDTVYQQVDTFLLTGTILSISLSEDGVAQKTVDLSSIADGVGTDDQQIDSFLIDSHTLILALEDDNQAPQTVDLTPYVNTEEIWIDSAGYYKLYIDTIGGYNNFGLNKDWSGTGGYSATLNILDNNPEIAFFDDGLDLTPNQITAFSTFFDAEDSSHVATLQDFGNGGGMYLQTHNVAPSASAHGLYGRYLFENDPSNEGMFVIEGWKHDGAGGLIALGDNSNLLSIYNGVTRVFRARGDGDVDISGSYTGDGRLLEVTNPTTATTSSLQVALDSLNNIATINFQDNQFNIFDDGDPTKRVFFELSNVTTSTDITLTVPDQDGTIALIGDAQVDTFELNGNILGISLEDDGVEQSTVDLSSLVSSNYWNIVGSSGNEQVQGDSLFVNTGTLTGITSTVTSVANGVDLDLQLNVGDLSATTGLNYNNDYIAIHNNGTGVTNKMTLFWLGALTGWDQDNIGLSASDSTWVTTQTTSQISDSLGIHTLNGQTGRVQTFAFGTDGIAPSWVSSLDTHTLNIPYAALNTYGLVSASLQIIDGIKIFDDNVGFGTQPPDSNQVHILGNMYLSGVFRDGTGWKGDADQILTSTGTATDWITPDYMQVTNPYGGGTSLVDVIDSLKYQIDNLPGGHDAVTLNGASSTALTISTQELNLSEAVLSLNIGVDSLIELSGVTKDAQNLGVFTGTTITDYGDIKTALQELETALEALPGQEYNVASETTITVTAALYELLPVNVTSSNVIIDPPATPSVGDWFMITDSRAVAGTETGDFKIIVDFTTAGQKLHSLDENYELNIRAGTAEFIYVDATIGWIIKD